MQKKKYNNEGFPRQTKSEGVHHHYTCLIRNVLTRSFTIMKKAKVHKTLKKNFALCEKIETITE